MTACISQKSVEIEGMFSERKKPYLYLINEKLARHARTILPPACMAVVVATTRYGEINLFNIYYIFIFDDPTFQLDVQGCISRHVFLFNTMTPLLRIICGQKRESIAGVCKH